MQRINLSRLMEAMAAAELDQSGLAREVGCTPGAINQIVQGKVHRSRLLPEIARVLGVSFDWLVGCDDTPPIKSDDVGASMRREERRVLDTYRQFSGQDQKTVLRVLEALAVADQIARGHSPLPPERALAGMFRGLLRVMPAKADLDEQAALLAKRLPIALAKMRDLLPPAGDQSIPADREIVEALAIHDHGQRP